MIPTFPDEEGGGVPRVPFTEVLAGVPIDDETQASLRVTSLGDLIFVTRLSDAPVPRVVVTHPALDHSYVRFCRETAWSGVSDAIVFVSDGLLSLDGDTWHQVGLPMRVHSGVIPVVNEEAAIKHGHLLTGQLDLAFKTMQTFLRTNVASHKRVMLDRGAVLATNIANVLDECQDKADAEVKPADNEMLAMALKLDQTAFLYALARLYEVHAAGLAESADLYLEMKTRIGSRQKYSK